MVCNVNSQLKSEVRPKFAEIIKRCEIDHRYNLHSHTQFCDGRNSMEEMAQAAFEAGMTQWGFTPHSPLPTGMVTSCNMQQENLKVYLAEAKRLKRLYEGRMEIYTSMEIDYLDDKWGATSDFFQHLSFDYLISSVHFIPTQDGTILDIDGRPEKFLINLERYFNGDLRYVVETYFAHEASMLKAGGFDMLGHFDKIRLNASFADTDVESRQWYKDGLQEVIRLIEETGVAVEINTKHLETYGTIFPSEIVIERLKKSGVPLVVNSDAHFTDKVNLGRSYGLSLLT